MNLKKVLQIPFLKPALPLNYLLGLLAVLSCLLISCGLNEKPLPLPEGITMKKLDNGFTYYLVPKGDPGKVKVAIVSKIGSLAEKPEQNGFAHMLEHTVFNGSKNFPGTSSVKAMENMGMRPGHDYNAYTSPMHTEYFMTIPENNLEYLEQCLRILKDWMFDLVIDPEVHENEKKIIIEEIKRGDTNASPTLAGTPLEGKRVLGTVEGIESVTVEQLYAFYKDNYTPGQLALIVYGRMDEKESAKLIEKLFGSVSYTSNNVNSYFDVNQQTIVRDEYESSWSWSKNTGMKIAYKTKPLVENTYEAVKQGLVNNMLVSILERRMQSSGNSSINNSSTNMGSLIPGNLLYNFSLQATGEAEYKKMLDAFCTTVAQALQHGFPQAELDYYVQKKMDWFKANKNNKHIILHQVKNHFLEGKVPLSGKKTLPVGLRNTPHTNFRRFYNHSKEHVGLP
jgi:predicted Zn-dependent peptidase